jgi:hypothetical protein
MMNKQEIIWAIEGHAVNARKISDAGSDPRRELARIESLIEEYIAAEETTVAAATAKRPPATPAGAASKRPPKTQARRSGRRETAVPYRYDIMPHVLAVLADGRVRDSDALREDVADRMGLSRQQRLALRPGSRSTTPAFTNEHAWALVYLQDPKYSGASDALILNVDPDGDPESYRITPEGLTAHGAGTTFEARTR